MRHWSYAKKYPNTFRLLCTCFGAKSIVCYFGVARPKGPQRKRSKILPNGKYDRHWPRTVRQMDVHRQTHSGKKNAGGVVNQAHTLFPSWHPHEVCQFKSKRMDRNPGGIGGSAFTPVKKPFAKEGIHAWETTKKR